MSGSSVLARTINNTCRVVLVSVITMSLFSGQAQAEPEEQQAYYLRGKQIEQLYTDYSADLKAEFEKLQLIVADERPDLLPGLKQPERRQYGYQLIPQILSDPGAVCTDTSLVPEESPFLPKSSRFSWPITESRIEKQTHKLVDQLALNLLSLKETGDFDNRDRVIENTIETYLELRKSHRFIDEMIQHNWLWQREVSLRKAQYDKSTLVHDAIVERALLIEALTAYENNDGQYDNTQAKTSFTAGDEVAGTELKFRIEQLNQQIQASIRGLTPRHYVRLEQVRPHLWIFHVPVYTDIEDERFLREFKQGVERRWCVSDGGDEYRVQVELKKISPTTLYGDAASGGVQAKAPQYAQQIDLLEHCGKFPGDAASLSSGAKKTYIQAGCLFVGPEDIAESTLVHEFGHLLGFADEYVRGYRDQGDDGYEIIEILSDGKDIMASSGKGAIRLHHFRALLAGNHYRVGLEAAGRGDHEAAVIAYRRAVEIGGDPANTASAYNNLGWSLKQLERNEEAIRAFEVAVKMRPGWSLPVNNLKLVQKSMNQTD